MKRMGPFMKPKENPNHLIPNRQRLQCCMRTRILSSHLINHGFSGYAEYPDFIENERLLNETRQTLYSARANVIYVCGHNQTSLNSFTSGVESLTPHVLKTSYFRLLIQLMVKTSLAPVFVGINQINI